MKWLHMYVSVLGKMSMYYIQAYKATARLGLHSESRMCTVVVYSYYLLRSEMFLINNNKRILF